MEKDLPLKKHIFDWKTGLQLAALYLLAQVLLAGISLFLNIDPERNQAFILFSYLFAFLFCIAGYYYLQLKPHKEALFLSFKNPKIVYYLLSVPLLIGGVFISDFVAQQVPTTGPFWGSMYEAMEKIMKNLSINPPVMFFLTTLSAPILEEIMFRGIIMKGMLNRGMALPKAALWSALIFGFIHFNPWQFVGGVIIGLVLGYVYYWSKSLLLPILLHALNNFVATYLLIFYGDESYGDWLHLSESSILLVGILLTVVFGGLILKKIKTENSNYGIADRNAQSK